MFKNIFFKSFSPFIQIIRLALVCIPVGIAIGSMVAFFLLLLSWAIHFRFAHKWLLYFLPAAGVVIHLLYKWYGKSAERGNNLIIDEIHEPGAGVPKRMAPLILITTVITHLFGGSAGREGTAVQIGGSLASFFASRLKLKKVDQQTVLTAGVAAGFGAVFGTPLTGAIFAIEVIAISRLPYTALLPCLIAGFIGDATVSAWGVHHTSYHIDLANTGPVFYGLSLPGTIMLIVKVICASALFGIVSYAFERAVHFIKSFSLKWIQITWLIPVIGGVCIIGLTFFLGKPDYLSLGVDAEYKGAVTIVSAFQHAGADTFSWFWKLLYTAVTLGTGFKGGEVTPLFYIGATLGNTLAQFMDAPVGLFAALGFIAVFAGATNTPFACTLMGLELFGGQYSIFFAVACFTAYAFSGNGGIYAAQKTALSKSELAKGHYLKRMFWKYRL